MASGGAGLRSNPSLVLRLVRGAVIWAVPFLLVAALALTLFYRSSTYRFFDEPLDSTITSLIAFAETEGTLRGQPMVRLTREPIDPRYQQSLSGRYWIIGTLSSDGRISPLLSSISMAGETLTIPASDARRIIANPGARLRTTAPGPDLGEPVRVVVRPVILPDTTRPVVMIAAADSSSAAKDIRNFAALVVGLMLLLSMGLIFGVLAQVRLGLRPLFDLRARVADVREGRSTRVDGDYPSEIQPLASELNSLIDHNKSVVEQAQTHVSNLAHALKTPLAVLLNEAQTSSSEFAGVVQRQSEAMKNQVDHHLRRARAAARGQAIGVSTSVSETIAPLARTLERIYRDKDMAFHVETDEALFFRGEKRDLEEMVGNLMDNACKWTKSEVWVRTKAVGENMLEICVADNGPGLAPDHYSEALKRGSRLDEATPGTGFGLAIVDDLARAYKGELQLAASNGGGLKVTLILPRMIQT